MSAFPLTRVPAEAPKPVKSARRNRDVAVAVVHVLNPSTAARLETAQALGKSLRCAYRNGKLHVWTEEAKP